MKLVVSTTKFVAATSHIKFRTCAVRKFGRGEKCFSQNSPIHVKRFATGMFFFFFFFSCYRDVLRRLVHKEWFVTATFCSDMLPSVLRLQLFDVKCAQNLKVHFSTAGSKQSA